MHSEGILSGELKHGPLATIDKDMPCIMVITKDNTCKVRWWAEEVCVLGEGGICEGVYAKLYAGGSLCVLKQLFFCNDMQKCLNALEQVAAQSVSYNPWLK